MWYNVINEIIGRTQRDALNVFFFVFGIVIIMTVKEAFLFLVSQLYNKSSCGRLEQKERDAIRIVRNYLNSND